MAKWRLYPFKAFPMKLLKDKTKMKYCASEIKQFTTPGLELEQQTS